jgi:5-methylcytosine-specific restriction endonuclease McrA
MPKKRRGTYRRSGSFHSSRDYKDPAYAGFRKSVRKRDGNKCQFPGCGSKTRLEVHHIKKWTSHPSMRFDVTNGITLCKSCHQRTKGSEEVYEPMFYKILEWEALKRLKKKDE